MQCGGSGRLELLTPAEHEARSEDRRVTDAGGCGLVVVGVAAAIGYGLVWKFAPDSQPLAVAAAVAGGVFALALCLLVPEVRQGLFVLVVRAVIGVLTLGLMVGAIAALGWLYDKPAQPPGSSPLTPTTGTHHPAAVTAHRSLYP
jgi:uncharacterized BrkB/YihY/UPF0761 family membrane protein